MQFDNVLQLCQTPPSLRSLEALYSIRDTLHGLCDFFRLWPSQIQLEICKLARPVLRVQNEVLASEQVRARDLCFILEGEAAVAMRAAPCSTQLKDVASLRQGDTFGELALLGATMPAFIVVRSKQLVSLAVCADELAASMLQQQQPQPTETLLGAAGAEHHEGAASTAAARPKQQSAAITRIKMQQLQHAAAPGRGYLENTHIEGTQVVGKPQQQEQRQKEKHQEQQQVTDIGQQPSGDLCERYQLQQRQQQQLQQLQQQQQQADMYRARHSAILHVAVMHAVAD